jgi:outer membrane protein OmpA-like peptidoglycan-associated protein
MLKKLCASTLLFANCVVAVFAQEDHWYDSFFISGALQYYLVPELFSGLIKPIPGFRAALGYEYKRFYLAVESGYTHIEGTNPLVLDLQFVPVVIKAGYAYPIRWGLGVQADLSFGYLFSKTLHYEDAINLILEKQKLTQKRSPLAGARLYAFYEFPQNRYPKKFAKVYAGGGVDLVFENDGIIPLPTLEAGISIKPFTLIRRKGSAESQIIRLKDAVYFEANSVTMREAYVPLLDRVGQQLKEDPRRRLILRAYSAPERTAEWQIHRTGEIPALSAARAEYCADYLAEHYGISASRIEIEHYRAEKAKNLKGAHPESFRCVELIVK